MILPAVIERLGGLGVAVDDAVSLAEIGQRPGLAARALYVIPDDETAREGASTTAAFEQLVDAGFAVVVVCATGAARSGPRNAAEDLKEAVKRLLIGWGHPAGRSATVYRGCRLISLLPITLQLRFTVPVRIRVTRTGAPDA